MPLASPTDCMQEHSAKSLKELVSIEPFTLAKMWVPIAIASVAAEAADLSFGGPEADFVLSPIILVFISSQAILAGWALGNFFKMRQVRSLQRHPARHA